MLGSGRDYTRQRRLRGDTRRYCVCIDNGALEAFLDRCAASSPVLASQGGAPC